MGKQVDMVRRRKVWDFKVRHPDATSDEIGAALGIDPRTVRKDITAAETAVNERAASALRASILSRNAQLIEAHMTHALQGKTRNAEVVLSCHKEIRELFGIDQPVQTKVEMNYNVNFVGIDLNEAL